MQRAVVDALRSCFSPLLKRPSRTCGLSGKIPSHLLGFPLVGTAKAVVLHPNWSPFEWVARRPFGSTDDAATGAGGEEGSEDGDEGEVFFYNPFGEEDGGGGAEDGSSADSVVTWVQGELCHVDLYLSNPMPFPVHLDSISMEAACSRPSSDGQEEKQEGERKQEKGTQGKEGKGGEEGGCVDVSVFPVDAVIPAANTAGVPGQTLVRVAVKPSQSGALVLPAFSYRLFGGLWGIATFGQHSASGTSYRSDAVCLIIHFLSRASYRSVRAVLCGV
jgi:hypothetical protein